MYEKEYDRIFIPFTTKMTSLEQMFHETLMEEIEKYLSITGEWLQSNDGLEYIHTQKSTIRSLDKLLKQHHINTEKLDNLLLIQYGIGRSYAHKNINRNLKDLSPSDEKSITKMLGGVKTIIGKFDKIIVKDLKSFIKSNRGETINSLTNKLKDWVHLNHTTPISAKTRSEMIARTEMNRSFTNGVLQTYSNYGLNSFDIINYNDIGVCKTCISIIQDNPYTLEEVMNLLPVHPFCRCLCVIHNTSIDIPLEEIENPIIIDMFN